MAMDPPVLPLGARIPEFDLPGVDGKNHALKDFAHSKLLALVFTCNHCPTAQLYEERLKKLAAEYHKNVAIVAVNPNHSAAVHPNELGFADVGDSLEDMKVRAHHKQFNFPYLDDGPEEKLSMACGAKATPHVFLFNSERKLCYTGGIDDSERPDRAKVHYLRDAIDALLAGREVKIKETQPIGCSTKWRSKAESVQAAIARMDVEPVSVDVADVVALDAVRKNDSGKLRLVYLWSLNSKPSTAALPDLVAINRMYRGRAFELVTIAVHSEAENARVLEFLKQQRAAFRNLIPQGTDPAKVIAAFDPDCHGSLPCLLLIGPKGDIWFKTAGSFEALHTKRVIVKRLDDVDGGWGA